jgi:hypothetical protein
LALFGALDSLRSACVFEADFHFWRETILAGEKIQQLLRADSPSTDRGVARASMHAAPAAIQPQKKHADHDSHKTKVHADADDDLITIRDDNENDNNDAATLRSLHHR